MSDPFLAEIRIFAGPFAPLNWASCDGQLMPISQNTALFALLGTMYGGNGTSTYQLPNFQGSVPIHNTMHAASLPFGSFDIGQVGGAQNVTLLTSEMPSHGHTLQGRAQVADANTAASNTSMGKPEPATNSAYQAGGSAAVSLNAQAISLSGGGLPHNNMQPLLTLNFIIALKGVFPPRG
ncbi:hypothetical protein AS156_21650 [Bradyrhizobium macuxiense]|uniref:Phage tail collar domain-containing protein n=1 Tax=Bradyrhizobium macuxiense TaxID=1755647 RepID=A0A109JCC1_9BRAD|nr:tail fiber protein [Bradyrhizobium macuxiense]KWV46308.1 hypothetical protein AS156_21650 [Bradyrhizobium macuxiense]